MNTREPKMTQSTNGQICFGLVFEEDAEFPWDEHNRWDDIDDWWLSYVLKWLPSNELYDKDGEYIGGVKPPQESIDRYYKEKHDFVKKAPKLPIMLVNYQSGDYPAYILAVPSTFKSASRGYPEEFHPMGLKVTPHEIGTLLEFCQKYDIEVSGEPQWYLSSYWG